MKTFIVYFFLILFAFNFILASDDASRDYALNQINDSQKIILDMNSRGFSVNFMNDTLIQAEMVFQQVDYAEILRNNVNSTPAEQSEARNALKLVDWKNLTYSNVLVYTDNIKKRKIETFFVLDELNSFQMTIDEFYSDKIEIKNSSQALKLLNNARESFSQERLNESELILQESKKSLEEEKMQYSDFNILTKNAQNFFQRYWIYILIISLFLIILVFVLYKISHKVFLKRKIEKIKRESASINRLILKLQNERYKTGKIPEIVYRIKLSKYKERLNEIKEQLPVLEKRLKK